ncbi:helix-turn-helix domain-containing protein [Paracoccus sanguinis]|uniref:DNA-binding protein n=1 Tax=Paracoccus sanguinis TaxID=1545044 RepID=A0A099GHS6_9RHOB|nr:helix-turn-helix transcriptional regulator [Paracoccus sanguinis]KGJ14823.1 DNA-binding protein [Paracoccus sanguinis]KGJ22251.1 DNA-binding protein [Paracoccus sanguinis]QJD16982.1 helix-turn-helix transcriptional regulator [Paracoccus sanguinis]
MERRNEKLVAAFAQVLRRRRKQAGLSQEELAYRAGVSTSYMSLLETRNRQPSLIVIDAISRELGTSMSDLLGEVEQTASQHTQGSQS